MKATSHSPGSFHLALMLMLTVSTVTLSFLVPFISTRGHAGKARSSRVTNFWPYICFESSHFFYMFPVNCLVAY